MEHSREYYQSFVTFLELVKKELRMYYPYEVGCMIAGDYWMAICAEFEKENLATIDYGNMRIIHLPPLAPVLADCKAKVREIDEITRVRRLDNASKWVAILCGIGGFLLSMLSIYLSFTAYTRQLAG